MIRTQLFLTESLSYQIQALADQKHLTKSDIIRELIAAGLRTEKPRETIGEALMGLAALGKQLEQIYPLGTMTICTG
jgi:hypothetical protein